MAEPQPAPVDPPGNLPRPPADFVTRHLTLIDAAGVWIRIHHKQWGAIHFSRRAATRWDCNNGPYGAMCAAETLAGAIFERFGDQFQQANMRVLTRTELEDFRVTDLSVAPGIPIADIRGEHLESDLQVDARLITGSYSVSREYSKALMDHPSHAGGFLYSSRHNFQRTNIVLFDRADVVAAVSVKGSSALKYHPQLMSVLQQHRIAII